MDENKVIEPKISEIIEYKNVKKVTGLDVLILGETDELYYKKEFRYSVDRITSKELNDPTVEDDVKCLWSDYKLLTIENLKKIKVYDSTSLFIQYRFTQEGEGDLYVDHVTLKVEFTADAKDKVIPDCYWYNAINGTGNGNACCVSPKIVFECAQCGNGSNLFNPYALGSYNQIYYQLSTLVSNMFGICVQYFKTSPNEKSRDVILKEYSLENVIDKQSIKILVPDNQFPTRELQFNTMMIDYPVQFEVHIVKSEFKKVFGQKSRPEPHDYMYMQTYMNKMYMVDAVAEADDFNLNGSYWRVSLVPYQEMSSIKFDNEDLQEETETIIFSAEGKFAEEVADEFADNRKDNQLNDQGDFQEGQDFLRRELNPNIRIVDEKIYNDWTIVSKKHYNMATTDRGEIAVEYKYNKGFTDADERMLSFIFKPNGTNKNQFDGAINVLKAEQGEHGGILLHMKSWSDLFVEGNFVNVKKIQYANGMRKILFAKKSGFLVEVEGDYAPTVKATANSFVTSIYESNEILRIKNDQQNMMSVIQTSNGFVLDILGERHKLDFGHKFENRWYALVLSMYHGNAAGYLYQFTGSDQLENAHSKIEFVGNAAIELGEYNFGDECYYDLMTGNVKVTNIRLWDSLCEQEKHNMILSQNVVDDTHNTLIVDNAQNELLINYKWS